jgi:hypothetical protein
MRPCQCISLLALRSCTGQDRKLYAFGGSGEHRLYIYTPGEQQWREGPPLPSGILCHFGSFHLPRGGEAASYRFLLRFCFDALCVRVSFCWALLLSNVCECVGECACHLFNALDNGSFFLDFILCAVMCLAYACASGRQIIVLGGSSRVENDRAPFLDTVYVYDMDSQVRLNRVCVLSLFLILSFASIVELLCTLCLFEVIMRVLSLMNDVSTCLQCVSKELSCVLTHLCVWYCSNGF